MTRNRNHMDCYSGNARCLLGQDVDCPMNPVNRIGSRLEGPAKAVERNRHGKRHGYFVKLPFGRQVGVGRVYSGNQFQVGWHLWLYMGPKLRVSAEWKSNAS